MFQGAFDLSQFKIKLVESLGTYSLRILWLNLNKLKRWRLLCIATISCIPILITIWKNQLINSSGYRYWGNIDKFIIGNHVLSWESST